MTLPDQWEPSDDLPDEIPETSNQENNEDRVPTPLPLLQGQTTHETAVGNSQNHTTNGGTLETSGGEVIADGDISAGSGVQDSCIEHHGVESRVTSTSAAENSDQSEAQDSDTRQLESQLAGEVNQSGPSVAGYSAASAPEPRRSGRERRPPNRFDNGPQDRHERLQMIMLLQADAHMLRDDPKNYKEAKSRPDWPLFHTASDYEMNSMNENGVWTKVQLEDVPLGRSILTGRWVYKTKRNRDGAVLKHKARWVIHGYKQQEGIDFVETFATVV